MEMIASDKSAVIKLCQEGNAKLKEAEMLMFNLPAGKEVCGRVCNGCYAIKEQQRWPSVVVGRERRLEASKSSDFAVRISAELSKKKKRPKYFRVHASGEFYSQDYVDSWVEIAKANPDIVFYAYTKRKKKFNFDTLSALSNFILIDSLHFKIINYGTMEEAPKGAFICPDQKGSTTNCGIDCTWCMSKGSADTNGVWFIKH